MSARRSERTRVTRRFMRNTEPAVAVAYLRFNLLVGAANAVASVEQKERLKQIPDLIRAGAELRKLGALVLEIMGPEWVPGPEWMEQIEALATKEEA
jgi:hypothetical protein